MKPRQSRSVPDAYGEPLKLFSTQPTLFSIARSAIMRRVSAKSRCRHSLQSLRKSASGPSGCSSAATAITVSSKCPRRKPCRNGSIAERVGREPLAAVGLCGETRPGIRSRARSDQPTAGAGPHLRAPQVGQPFRHQARRQAGRRHRHQSRQRCGKNRRQPNLPAFVQAGLPAVMVEGLAAIPNLGLRTEAAPAGLVIRASFSGSRGSRRRVYGIRQ